MSKGERCYDWCMEYHPETFPDGITNGAGWYSLNGGMQDWIYKNTNEFDITLEIGCNQYPAEEAMPQYWEFNKKALLSYIQAVHRGIKGTVQDAVTGKYLAGVNVHVRNKDHNVTSTKYGDYFRILVPGIYEILFQLEGYESQQITVIIQSTMPQIVPITLKPLRSYTLSDETRPTISPAITTAGTTEAPSVPGDVGDHSIVVATLVMTIITVLILVLMIGAYIIQRRRLSRSQSMSVELQPRSASTGISLPLHGNATSGGSSGHLGA